jgi:hypothetical protein
MLQIDDLLESSPQQTAFTRGLKLLRVSSAAILLLIECLPRIHAQFNLPGIRARPPFLKGAYALCYVFVKGQSCRRIESRVARQAFAS